MKRSSKKAKKPSLNLRPLKLPQQTHHRLANGLHLTAVPRGPLPMVSVRLVARAGSAADPAGKLGLAELCARLLRRGAAGRTANQISDAIDQVGAGLSAWASEDSFGVSLTTPVRHFEPMLELFGAVVMSPDFAQPELELLQRRTVAQIATGLDDPDTLADRAQVRAVWGQHPYGHEPDGQTADVERVVRDDLTAYHRSHLAPSGASLFMVGAIDPQVALRSAERVFGGWQGTAVGALTLPSWQRPARAGEVVIVDKPEQTQVQVRMVGPGVYRGHPDHFPLLVANAVLGGGFTSRLVTQIRVKRGLTYGAGSHLEQLAAAGTFNFDSFTKTESLTELIDVALAEVAKMKAKGPSPTEVATAQRYIAGLYPSRLETNDSVATALADMRLFSLPDDWVEQYRERVAAVTVREAAEAASTHLFGDNRVTVLVGNAQQLLEGAARYGKVSVITPAELA